MTKKLTLIAFIILLSQSALACSLVGGQEQYEKNVEGNISMYLEAYEKYKKLGFADDNEQLKAAKEQYQSAKETQPISKYVDVEKYQQIYKDCAEKAGDNAPIAPCGNSYTIKECAHKAYENSKKE